MSGVIGGHKCPKCNSDLYFSMSDWKPADTHTGNCFACGYFISWTEGFNTLETLNEIRANNYELVSKDVLEPLTKLPKQNKENE